MNIKELHTIKVDDLICGIFVFVAISCVPVQYILWHEALNYLTICSACFLFFLLVI